MQCITQKKRQKIDGIECNDQNSFFKKDFQYSYHSKILLYGNFGIFLWLPFLIELRLYLAALFWGVCVIFNRGVKVQPNSLSIKNVQYLREFFQPLISSGIKNKKTLAYTYLNPQCISIFQFLRLTKLKSFSSRKNETFNLHQARKYTVECINYECNHFKIVIVQHRSSFLEYAFGLKV